MTDERTSRRKDEHLELCATAEVAPKENSALFECVRLVHCAMPELAVSELDLSTRFLGKTLKAPILVSGMTGGTERAAQVNRELATVAEQFGVAFGLGSQRAMSEHPELSESFQVRKVAPSTVVLGNVGLGQARALGVDGVRRLVDAVGADGLALHLNAAQELTQPEGDRDFRGGYALVEKLASALGDRLLVKETGCGLSPKVATRLVEAGARCLDVSGLGGTSWVRVEQLRSQGVAAEVGAQMSGWGIPTAAAVAGVRRAVGTKALVVASGGIRTGLEIAKAIALGADLAGLALPLFRAQQQGGVEAASQLMEALVRGLSQALLLTGSRDLAALRQAPRVLTGELKDWLAAL